MKDFIYVDSDLATSYFAQINRGAIMKASASSQNSQQNLEDNNKQISNAGTAKIALGIDAGWNRKTTYTDRKSNSITTNSGEATEIILHDYLIDSLISDLNDMGELKTEIRDFKEGDFVLYSKPSTIIDLYTAQNNLNPKVFESMVSFDDSDKKLLVSLKKLSPKTHEISLQISELQKSISKNENETKNTLHIIKQMQELTSQLSILFPDTVIMTIGDSIALCDRDKFRLSPSAMLPITLSTRPVTILGTVISKANANDVDMSGKTFDILSKSSLFIPETVLREIGIKKDGDYNVRPIAIYFEDENI